MGMYTEILIKVDLQSSLPSEVEGVLQFLFNGGEKPTTLPDHPLFKCSRWGSIGTCSSYYHIPWACSKYSEGYIFSRSDLKNYEGEVELFFDWIRPYVMGLEGQCIGYSWYEEFDTPSLVYL